MLVTVTGPTRASVVSGESSTSTGTPDTSPLPARDVVAMSLAFSLGWLLLRDFIQAATDAGDDVPEKWFSAMADLLVGHTDPRPTR